MRIITDIASATSPMAIAVSVYWIAMTLWSWLQMYFVMNVCWIVQVCVLIRDRNVSHQTFLPVRVTRMSPGLRAARDRRPIDQSVLIYATRSRSDCSSCTILLSEAICVP